MKFDELKAHVDALQKLLAVPTPGLPTWDKAVKDHCDQIARASPLAQDSIEILKDIVADVAGLPAVKSCKHIDPCTCFVPKAVDVLNRFKALERA